MEEKLTQSEIESLVLLVDSALSGDVAGKGFREELDQLRDKLERMWNE